MHFLTRPELRDIQGRVQAKTQLSQPKKYLELV